MSEKPKNDDMPKEKEQPFEWDFFFAIILKIAVFAAAGAVLLWLSDTPLSWQLGPHPFHFNALWIAVPVALCFFPALKLVRWISGSAKKEPEESNGLKALKGVAHFILWDCAFLWIGLASLAAIWFINLFGAASDFVDAGVAWAWLTLLAVCVAWYPVMRKIMRWLRRKANKSLSSLPEN